MAISNIFDKYWIQNLDHTSLFYPSKGEGGEGGNCHYYSF